VGHGHDAQVSARCAPAGVGGGAIHLLGAIAHPSLGPLLPRAHPSLGPLLPRAHSELAPLQSLLTLEGGRPRSRVENKISTQPDSGPSAILDFLFGLPLDLGP
jgi:hypothetical protein